VRRQQNFLFSCFFFFPLLLFLLILPSPTPHSFSSSTLTDRMSGMCPFKIKLILKFQSYGQSVGLLGRRISLSQGRNLHRTTQTHTDIMPVVGFDPTIPAFDGRRQFMP
jgi:hypothetical protein